MIGSGIRKKIKCRYNDDFLSVRVYGNGKKNIIAFHGYGQDGSIFLKLSVSNPNLTIYSFDLFYHGDSGSPNPDHALSHSLLRKIFKDFLLKTSITDLEIVAFSMGGKYALSILHSFPKVVKSIILIAPDGVRKNFWYQMATQSMFFRKLFHYSIDHPTFFFKTALLLDRLKLVDGRVRKFATNEMDNSEKRRKVYNSWVYLRFLFHSPSSIARVINSNGITTKLIIGRYDRIITTKFIKGLSDLLKEKEIIVLECGHSRLLMRAMEKLNDIQHKN